MAFFTPLITRLTYRRVGQDRFGNTYWESRRKMRGYNRHRRRVLFAGEAEPTKVPPEWHAWLHHLTESPLPEEKPYPWMQEHRPNPTGTPAAWRPPGHDYRGGRSRPAGGDYEAWTPGG
jgi:NADH:ubiquinone oxidoreductase subunit